MATSSSRLCPTKEQVMILEEIYNKGRIKSPSAFQIQQITTHLSFYGKIEGKNVFYWFQNHKARERQKLRRRLMQSQKQLQLTLYHQQQPCWYHYSAPSSALVPFLQGRRSECVAHQHSSIVCQPTIWHDINGKRVQRSLEHGHLLADKLSPHCSIGQAPLRTLELFPLITTVMQTVNSFANHAMF